MSKEIKYFTAEFAASNGMKADFGAVSRSGGGVSNYEQLTNKPAINDVTLSGNKTIEDLGVRELTNLEIAEIINRVFD